MNYSLICREYFEEKKLDVLPTITTLGDGYEDLNVVGEEKPTKETLENFYKENKAYFEEKEDVKIKAKAKKVGEPYKKLSELPISFTKDDAMGMLQIKTAFELGVPKTIMKFSNGTELPISAKDFKDFAIWFAKKRNSFFE